MLVDFQITNFRSFKGEQSFSLIATKDKTLADLNTISTEIKSLPSLLRSAVIYGANASGKSNFIKALQYMRGVIIESASLNPNQTYNIRPFRLDKVSSKLPIKFEITFIIKAVRYQYSFALNSQRILHEYLLVYKSFKPQKWFNRYYDEDKNEDIYEFGPSLKGQKSLWEEATRPNALFLSMAVQLNSQQLRPIFDWFSEKLIIFNSLSPLSVNDSLEMLHNPGEKKEICDFLKAADISIADIQIQNKKIIGKTIHFDLIGEKSEVKEEEQEVAELQFHHITEKGEAFLDLQDESDGTQRLLFMTGPVLKILKQGKIFIVDELDNSLHPLIVRRLIELFNNPIFNQEGAQIIFSTHDVSLLDNELFRRDQIWFVEKNNDQESSIYPLSDFSPRKSEAIAKGYLMGRYGALPLLNNWQISEVTRGT